MTPAFDPYARGWEAYEAGTARSANPYAESVMPYARSDWAFGWMDAQSAACARLDHTGRPLERTRCTLKLTRGC